MTRQLQRDRRLTEAEKEALKLSGPYPGAFWRGHRAALDGSFAGVCPYDGGQNMPFRNVWLRGFQFGVREYNRRAR